MFFSVIIPLYNRPQEIKELLQTLTSQTYKHFEVLVIEDGSTNDAADIVKSFADKLDLHYYVKENAGQGHAITRLNVPKATTSLYSIQIALYRKIIFK
jgi:glycosyltransferase involved in cell wall biosynthesis